MKKNAVTTIPYAGYAETPAMLKPRLIQGRKKFLDIVFVHSP